MSIEHYEAKGNSMKPVDTVGSFDFVKGVYPCIGCARPVKLHFNGGEGDVRFCCGYRYESVVSRMSLHVYKEPQTIMYASKDIAMASGSGR